jgi:hypothetical protein
MTVSWVSLFVSIVLLTLVSPGAGLVTGGALSRLLIRFGVGKAPSVEAGQEVVSDGIYLKFSRGK